MRNVKFNCSNRKSKNVITKKVITIFLLIFYLANTYAALQEKDVMPLAPSFIGRDISEIKKSGVLFENIFPEKRGEVLKCAKFPNAKLWNFGLLYSKNQIITTITFIIQKDYIRAQKECPGTIKFLINKLGKDYLVKYVELDSVVSSEKGYSIIWDKDTYFIAIKFGPLLKNAKKFQLQLTISSDSKQKHKRLGVDLENSIPQNNKKIIRELIDYFGNDIGLQ